MSKERPSPSSDHARARMSKQATSATAPEMALRQELHRRGYRFRVQLRPEAGVRTTGDLVFTRARVVVFVDGCFWHRCPAHGTMPRANASWWADKLDANVARDNRANEELRRRGWRVVRIWEHATAVEGADAVAQAVVDATGPQNEAAAERPAAKRGHA